MLPFLQPKKLATSLIARFNEKNSPEVEGEEGEPMPELVAAMERLISALSMKDATSAADAFEEAFNVCESYPHNEVGG
jgi:hypothetical protein